MEPRWFDTAADAIEYATSEYWVDPIQVSNDEEASSFDDALVALDWSESGLVHFGNRRSTAAAAMGSARSERKTAAARENGKRGGRPRKDMTKRQKSQISKLWRDGRNVWEISQITGVSESLVMDVVQDRI